MNFDSRDVTLTAVFAALYVIINVVQTMLPPGNPAIYGPVQLRIADVLIPLAVLFGWPIVGGVTIGCFITNAYYYIGTIDVVFGTVANFVAACLILFLRKRRLLACVIGSLPIGIIVGGYLWLFFPPPEIFSTIPVPLASIASITISSLIVMAVIGFSLLSILSRRGIIEPLKSRGLKVVDEK